MRRIQVTLVAERTKSKKIGVPRLYQPPVTRCHARLAIAVTLVHTRRLQLEILLAPADLLRVTGARLADIARQV